MKQPILFFLTIAGLALSEPRFAAEPGGAAPACELANIKDGRPIDIHKFQGKVVYLDFWASWCISCAKSFPFMNELQRQFGDKGLQLVGVNLDENPDDAKTFLERYPADFLVATDREEGCATSYDVRAMPSSYLIGRDGTLRYVQTGFRNEEAKDLRAQLEKLLAEETAVSGECKPDTC